MKKGVEFTISAVVGLVIAMIVLGVLVEGLLGIGPLKVVKDTIANFSGIKGDILKGLFGGGGQNGGGNSVEPPGPGTTKYWCCCCEKGTRCCDGKEDYKQVEDNYYPLCGQEHCAGAYAGGPYFSPPDCKDKCGGGGMGVGDDCVDNDKDGVIDYFDCTEYPELLSDSSFSDGELCFSSSGKAGTCKSGVCETKCPFCQKETEGGGCEINSDADGTGCYVLNGAGKCSNGVCNALTISNAKTEKVSEGGFFGVGSTTKTKLTFDLKNDYKPEDGYLQGNLKITVSKTEKGATCDNKDKEQSDIISVQYGGKGTYSYEFCDKAKAFEVTFSYPLQFGLSGSKSELPQNSISFCIDCSGGACISQLSYVTGEIFESLKSLFPEPINCNSYTDQETCESKDCYWCVESCQSQECIPLVSCQNNGDSCDGGLCVSDGAQLVCDMDEVCKSGEDYFNDCSNCQEGDPCDIDISNGLDLTGTCDAEGNCMSSVAPQECPFGEEITSPCECGGETVSSGYCCEGVLDIPNYHSDEPCPDCKGVSYLDVPLSVKESTGETCKLYQSHVSYIARNSESTNWKVHATIPGGDSGVLWKLIEDNGWCIMKFVSIFDPKGNPHVTEISLFSSSSLQTCQNSGIDYCKNSPGPGSSPCQCTYIKCNGENYIGTKGCWCGTEKAAGDNKWCCASKNAVFTDQTACEENCIIGED